MNTEMRLKKQELPKEMVQNILKNSSSGVLALLGPDGYPYGLPVSYLYADGKIYIHGAKAGYKHQCIANCDKACFTVVGYEENVPAEYTAYYKSVIAFGRVSVVADPEEMRNAIEELAAKYVPDDEAGRLREIDREWSALSIIRMDIEEVKGKQSMEAVSK